MRIFRKLILIMCFFQSFVLKAQPVSFYPKVTTSKFALKSNILYDALTTINFGIEMKVSLNMTLDLSGNYNPWTFSNNKKFKHILVQPELRYWFCEPYNRHFLGMHAHYAFYNIGGIKMPFDMFPNLKDNRYEGWLVGAGISYGYHWYLTPRWNLEATVGMGYIYVDYERYDYVRCGELRTKGTKSYFAPTKLGITLVYIVK